MGSVSQEVGRVHELGQPFLKEPVRVVIVESVEHVVYQLVMVDRLVSHGLESARAPRVSFPAPSIDIRRVDPVVANALRQLERELTGELLDVPLEVFVGAGADDTLWTRAVLEGGAAPLDRRQDDPRRRSRSPGARCRRRLGRQAASSRAALIRGLAAIDERGRPQVSIVPPGSRNVRRSGAGALE